VLSQRSSSEPGRWRTERTPYLREIMDCLSPSSPVQRVALMKGAQIGGTECGNCWIGYVIHQAPGPMMAVSPTVELAKRNSKQRIDPLIEESEVLRERVKERRSRDSGNTVLSKEFPGGVLILTGANSAVGLRSMPARYLFLEEVDGYPGDVEGEGDPILLAERRSATFQRRKILLVSTPKTKGLSRIQREYERRAQRLLHPSRDTGARDRRESLRPRLDPAHQPAAGQPLARRRQRASSRRCHSRSHRAPRPSALSSRATPCASASALPHDARPVGPWRPRAPPREPR
jgi:phage terminase large subunit GpA-like protein